jgi:nitrile hydratase
MGGAQNFGPVIAEKDEPYFHHAWERRTLGLVVAMGSTRMWTIDMSRASRESLPAAQYLSSSYYQIWLAGLRKLLVQRGLVTAEELDQGRALVPSVELDRRVSAADIPAALARGSPSERTLSQPARFRAGERVRTRNLHPATHTRLPRYCRDKAGTIMRIHGAHTFPDSNAVGKGEDPRWLYSVRFEAAELWGHDTTAAAVYVDLWEPYLEPAP